MNYTTREAITVALPSSFLAEALDDNADGQEDLGLFDSLVAVASRAVDGYLAGRFDVPFANPLPPLVVEATRIFALELIYERRGHSGESNPFTERGDMHRQLLAKIADGRAPLAVTKRNSRDQIAVIVEESKTFSPHLNL